ncbi:MAG TPA: FAD:protein FMN transferase [Planctomycetes bacterium]|nr:FAD:protein FMN transferase [Planctomycetota bacterium]
MSVERKISLTKKYMYSALIIAGAVVAAFGIRVLVGPRLKTANSGYRVVMGTFANITAVAGDSKTAGICVEAAFDKLKYVDEVMSDYKAESQLSQVNREAFGRPVHVDENLFEVLRISGEYSRQTENAFDITVGPIVDLWRQAQELKRLPTEAELAEARSRVGFGKLALNRADKTVRFGVKGMRLDLGGIAKGYAIDSAIEAMEKAGAVGGLVDLGGDVRCFGTPSDNKASWLVGLQDPAADDRLLLVLKLRDMAVATSGGYRRFTEIDGQRYSHIINPGAGASADELISVSIIAQTATAADTLATAVSVLGGEKGLELIDSLSETEAILVGAGKTAELIHTEGVRRYVDTTQAVPVYSTASKVAGQRKPWPKENQL